jgi:hypothetical protein
VAAAIEAYVTKLMETNAASRALWTEMRELYPSAGPLGRAAQRPAKAACKLGARI